ncbi:MAG: RNA methyltransferase [Thermoanaerobaculia bacterium]|nr:RNA methyltransferase [Thermoanaerobaculia bacterium]
MDHPTTLHASSGGTPTPGSDPGPRADGLSVEGASTETQGPAIILVEPQLGENIGAAARAMANGGLTDLRIVNPRDGWPNPRAQASASGADWILDGARLCSSTEEAVAGLTKLYASTARPRDMVKDVQTPRQAVAAMRSWGPNGMGSGVLFGPERTGLRNEHLVLSSELIVVPVNPRFSSLNLAQAVLIVSYEWYQGGLDPAQEKPQRYDRGARPANVAELLNFFDHLESQLDAAGFLRPPEKRTLMVQNLRNLLQRAELTEQEVRTLHGVVRALSGRRREDLPPSPTGSDSLG